MTGRLEDREAIEYGGEAPTVEVLVYRHGDLVHRELCESEEAAADIAAAWAELDGIECVVDDLAVKHRPGQILEPDSAELLLEEVFEEAYPDGQAAEP